MRPLVEDRLRLITRLPRGLKPENKARLVREFVRAAARKLKSIPLSQ